MTQQCKARFAKDKKMSHKEIFGHNEADELLLRKNYADISNTGRVLNNLIAFVSLMFAILFVLAGLGLKLSHHDNLASRTTANERITEIAPSTTVDENTFGNLLLFVGFGMLISIALFWLIISKSIGTLANIMSR
jgi:uncharacterized membrane protein